MNRVTESGVVVRRDHDVTWVKTIQRSSCAGCEARHGCGQSSLQGWLENADLIAVATDGQQVRIGDSVSLSIAADALARAALLVYLLPLLGLFAGILMAGKISTAEWLAVVGASVGFFIGCITVRFLTQRLRGNLDYMPTLEPLPDIHRT